MSREIEKIFKEFEKYISDRVFEDEDEYEQALTEFINMKNNMEEDREDVWYYLDMAYEADSAEDALKYAEKALETDKNCLDAEIIIADLSNDDPEDLKTEYEILIKKAEKHLKEQDILNEENMGSFWGIIETRPYMRLRNFYIKLLQEMGKNKMAINECEDLLKLSENDNLGIRYTLISLYAFFEDEKNVLKLYKKYKENSTLMLLPIVAMYYKMDNYKKAKKYLDDLTEVNSELLDFVYSMGENDEIEVEDVAQTGMYAPGSREEIIVAIAENPILYNNSLTFFLWLAQILSK